MLLKIDASQLEWRAKVWLAQDEVGMREIANGEDLHSDNQKAFNLPSRLIAKIFIYRMIFADAFGDRGTAGPAYSYAHDADFMKTSSSVKYWERVCDRFFEKYPQIKEHSLNLIREAISTGRITVPSGRFFPYAPQMKHGQLKWPHTQILNYPVQGISADFVQIARLLIWEALEAETWGDQVILINTVHDDVEADVDNDPELVYNTSILLEKAFAGINEGFRKRYGVHVNVPMAGEVKFGMCLNENFMVKFNPKTFEQDYKKAITLWQQVQ